jgi:hypothetical protein
MPLINYEEHTDFCDRAEAVATILQHALIKLRDHMNYDEEPDQTVIHAAENLSAILEDAHAEIEMILNKFERMGNKI